MAACVNVVPQVRSYYRWKGKLEIRRRVSADHQDFARAVRRIEGWKWRSCIRYEVPELVALPVVDGAENYLNWLGQNLRGGAAE